MAKAYTRMTVITLILFAIGCIVAFATLSESDQVRADEAPAHSSMQTCIDDTVNARILDTPKNPRQSNFTKDAAGTGVLGGYMWAIGRSQYKFPADVAIKQSHADVRLTPTSFTRGVSKPRHASFLF